MNAATAPPKSVGAVASSIASAITSPIGCSPAAFVPLGVSRPERMSAVTLPTTRFASGAESFVYLSRIAVSAGSFATSWVTMRFVAFASTICFDWWSIRRSMSVITRPNDDALVTQLAGDRADVRRVGVRADHDLRPAGSSPWAIDVTSGPLKLTHLLTSVYASGLAGAG